MGMVEPWCWRKGEDRKKRKYRKLDLHENDTLEAIQMATAKIGDVPTQDAVWNIWIKRKTEPREMQRTKFDKDLARLGFDWLPPKKPQRGESVLGRSTTGRGTKELGDFEI
jgi:hypothetical protein